MELPIGNGYRLLPPLGEGFPASWSASSIISSVSLHLNGTNSVNREFYKTYATDSVDHAVRNIKYERMFLCYSFAATEEQLDPFFELDWPLSRRGQNRPERRSMSDVSQDSDVSGRDLLFELHNKPTADYSTRSVTRLKVVGTDPEDCRAKWETCARTLRSLLDSI